MDIIALVLEVLSQLTSLAQLLEVLLGILRALGLAV